MQRLFSLSVKFYLLERGLEARAVGLNQAKSKANNQRYK